MAMIQSLFTSSEWNMPEILPFLAQENKVSNVEKKNNLNGMYFCFQVTCTGRIMPKFSVDQLMHDVEVLIIQPFNSCPRQSICVLVYFSRLLDRVIYLNLRRYLLCVRDQIEKTRQLAMHSLLEVHIRRNFSFLPLKSN